MNKFILFSLFVISSFCALAQKGWQYDKFQGFSLKDTSYFETQRLSNISIFSEGELLGFASFNNNFLLDGIFSRDTLWQFKYDSIGRTVLAVSQLGKWGNSPPNTNGDSIIIKYFEDSTITTTKTYFFGKSLKIHNDSLNKKYHKAEYVDVETREVDEPLPKKLKTKYEDNLCYIVKTHLLITFKSYKRDTKQKIKYPLKRGYFEKPEYLIANYAELIESQNINRLYHQKVCFDNSGRIKKFIFTDNPQQVYTVKYSSPFSE